MLRRGERANLEDLAKTDAALADWLVLGDAALVLHTFGSSFGEESASRNGVPSVRLRSGGHVLGVLVLGLREPCAVPCPRRAARRSACTRWTRRAACSSSRSCNSAEARAHDVLGPRRQVPQQQRVALARALEILRVHLRLGDQRPRGGRGVAAAVPGTRTLVSRRGEAGTPGVEALRSYPK
mgnify:CR=1 FL=1